MNWTIIKTERAYYKALNRLEEIFNIKNNSKHSDEFDLLTMLINKYEEENFKIEEADPLNSSN